MNQSTPNRSMLITVIIALITLGLLFAALTIWPTRYRYLTGKQYVKWWWDDNMSITRVPGNKCDICFKGDAGIGTNLSGTARPTVEMSPYALRISDEVEKAQKERGYPIIADGHDRHWQYKDGKALIAVDVYRVDRISGEVYRIEKGEWALVGRWPDGFIAVRYVSFAK